MERLDKEQQSRTSKISLEEVKESLDVGVLKGIFGELLEKAGIPKEESQEKLQMLSPERIFKGGFNADGRLELPQGNIYLGSMLFGLHHPRGVAIKLGHEKDAVGLGRVTVDLKIFHEFTHLVFSKNEQRILHGKAKSVKWRGKNVDRWPGVLKVKTGVSKTQVSFFARGDRKEPMKPELKADYRGFVIHEALNEAITERLTFQILKTYYERTGQRQNVQRLKIIMDAENKHNVTIGNMTVVKSLEVLLEVLSTRTGLEKERIWESFLVGYSKDPRNLLEALTKWFSEEGLESLYQQYTRTSSVDLKNQKRLLSEFKKQATKVGISDDVLAALQLEGYLPRR